MIFSGLFSRKAETTVQNYKKKMNRSDFYFLDFFVKNQFGHFMICSFLV